MLKMDYLKAALQLNKYKDKSWILSVITVNNIPEPSPDQHYTIFNDRQHYYTFTPEGKQVIEEASVDAPLFPIHSTLTIDGQYFPTLKEPTVTTFGNLLFNLICVWYPFQGKIPYQNKRVDAKALETEIATLMQDTPKNGKKQDGVIYVDEYLAYGKGLQFIASLSPYITNSGGLKLILPPPGLKEFKEQLMKKYEGRLNNPVEFAAFEKELLAFDQQYLKDDPGYGKFISAKIANNSRKKMYLDMGIELGFDDRVLAKPIVSSLSEGVPLDPENFATSVNGSRYGSFSRGSETVKGGVSAKVLLRALSPYTVTNTDCGSHLGLTLKLTEDVAGKYLGRSILTAEGVILLTKESIGSYIGKTVTLRSPMYCKLEGERVCKICAGEALLQYPDGLTIPATEISSIILTTALKKMHTNQLATVSFTVDELLS